MWGVGGVRATELMVVLCVINSVHVNIRALFM